MATIEIAPGWLDAIERYAEGLMADSIRAAQQASKVFRESVVEQARQAGWSEVADNIQLWSEDGHLVIGVQDPMFASQASVLEYGDSEHDPRPALRVLTSATRDANAAMREELGKTYGPWNVNAPRIKGMTYDD
jgi:hypothetical protein